MANKSKIEIVEKTGWYAFFDEDAVVKVDMCVRTGAHVNIHLIEDDDEHAYKAGDWPIDCENEEDEIKIYDTEQEAVDARDTILKKKQAEESVNVEEIKKDIIKKLKPLSIAEVGDIIKEWDNYYTLISKDKAPNIVYERAFTLIRNKSITYDHKGIIPLSRIMRVEEGCTDTKVVTIDGNTYYMGDKDWAESFRLAFSVLN